MPMTDDELRTYQFGIQNHIQNMVDNLTMYQGMNDMINYNKNVDLINHATAELNATMHDNGFTGFNATMTNYWDGTQPQTPTANPATPPATTNPLAPEVIISSPTNQPSTQNVSSNNIKCNGGEQIKQIYLKKQVDFNNCCLYNSLIEYCTGCAYTCPEQSIIRFFAYMILKLSTNDGKLTEDQDIANLKRLSLEPFPAPELLCGSCVTCQNKD